LDLCKIALPATAAATAVFGLAKLSNMIGRLPDVFLMMFFLIKCVSHDVFPYFRISYFSVEEDYGDIFFDFFEPSHGIVRVRLAGSCVGCPPSSVTTVWRIC